MLAHAIHPSKPTRRRAFRSSPGGRHVRQSAFRVNPLLPGTGGCPLGRDRRAAFYPAGRHWRRAVGSARPGCSGQSAGLGRYHAAGFETGTERRVTRWTCAGRWGVGGRVSRATLSPVNGYFGWRDRPPVVSHDWRSWPHSARGTHRPRHRSQPASRRPYRRRLF